MNSRNLLTIFALLLLLAMFTACADAAVSADQARERYDQANVLLQEGKSAEAISSWQSLIAEAADQREICAKAQLGVGKAYLALSDTDKALEAFRRVVQNYGTFHPLAGEAQISIGVIYKDKKVVLEAVSAFEAVVSNYSDQADLCIAALGKMGRTYREAAKQDEALASFKRIVDGYPSRPEAVAEAMIARVEIYDELRNYDSARSECKKLISMFSNNKAMKGYCRQAQFRVPCILKAAGRLQEALDEFAKIAPTPDDPSDTYAMQALYKRSQILHDIGEPKKALTELETLIATYPQHKNTSAQSKMLMARCLSETGDYAGARKILKELTADPTVQGSSLLTKELAALQLEIGTESEAQETLRQYSASLAKSGDSVRSDFGQLELAYHIKHDIREAGPLAAKCIRKYPDDPRVAGALFIQGEYLMSTGDTAEALKSFNTLIEKYGNKPGNEYNCAYAKVEKASCLISSDQAAAREVIKELCADVTVKRHPNLLHHLFAAQKRSGDGSWIATAREYVAAMAKTDSGSGDFAKLEVAYFFENNIKEATELSANFLEQYPKHGLAPEAAFIRGKCLQLIGDKEGALAVLDTLVQAYGSLPSSRTYTNASLGLAADILAESGRVNEAVQRLGRVTTTNAEEKASNFDHMGRIYSGAQNWREAAKAFEHERRTTGAPAGAVYRAAYNLAECRYRMGDMAAARFGMLEIVRQAPADDLWARKCRARIYQWDVAMRNSAEVPAP